MPVREPGIHLSGRPGCIPSYFAYAVPPIIPSVSAAVISEFPGIPRAVDSASDPLSGLNYEIRTPLSGILGVADMLLETNLSESQRAYVNAMRVCAEDINQVLSATLEYAGPADDEAAVLIAFDPAALMESAVEEHRFSAEARRLEIRWYMDAGVPTTLIGDAARLRQAVCHALSGVIRLSRPGPLNIHLSARPAGARTNNLRLVISDANFEAAHDGLAGSMAPRAFSGMLVGIALAERLLHAMGGTVKSETDADGGNRTTLVAPLKVPSTDGLTTSSEQTAAPRILLVEDNEVFQTVVRHMLRRHDLQLDCVSNGAAAIEAARSSRYDLLLMDLRMPDMDGFAAADEIRRLPGYETTPILALTANTSGDFRSLSAAHGMKEFLPKPIRSADLVAAIRKWLP
jgi:CheY-like chemotaxis protein